MLERENVEAIARALSIDVVPIILRGTINEAIEYVKSASKINYWCCANGGFSRAPCGGVTRPCRQSYYCKS